MRLVACWRAITLVLLSFWLASCATHYTKPKATRLVLSHRDLIVAKLHHVGTVGVRPFIDYRPMNEHMPGSDEADIGQPQQILSYHTTPTVPEYLQSVLRIEARRTEVLTPSVDPTYQLTGIIYHMAVGKTSDKREPHLFDDENTSRADGSLVPHYFAQVRFLAVLKKGNKVVFRNTYSQRETRPIELALKPDQLSKLLDEAVTKAVAALYMDIAAKAQRRKSGQL